MTDNVYTALAKAQAHMGKLYKGSVNPHFKSAYSTLSEVMEVVLPPCNDQGLAIWHSMPDSHTMRTTISHGSSDTHIACDVPLIVDKQNMQGMKSATTYAKRIGVESVCGVAPSDDDDGNAASAAPPPKPEPPKFVAELEVLPILREANKIGWTEDEIKKVVAGTKAQSWKMLTQRQFDFVKQVLSEKFDGDHK